VPSPPEGIKHTGKTPKRKRRKAENELEKKARLMTQATSKNNATATIDSETESEIESQRTVPSTKAAPHSTTEAPLTSNAMDYITEKINHQTENARIVASHSPARASSGKHTTLLDVNCTIVNASNSNLAASNSITAMDFEDDNTSTNIATSTKMTESNCTKALDPESDSVTIIQPTLVLT